MQTNQFTQKGGDLTAFEQSLERLKTIRNELLNGGWNQKNLARFESEKQVFLGLAQEGGIVVNDY